MTARAFIYGKTPKAVARLETRWAHTTKFPKGTTKLDGWQMNAVQRLQDLDRLASHRRRNGPALGAPEAWARVVANLCRVRDNQLSATTLNDTVRRLGLPKIDTAIVAMCVRDIAGMAWGKYALYSPEEAGKLLKVTAVERDAADLLKLDAIDEPTADRRRRLDRESKRARRAVKAAASTKAPSKAQMARALGVSRPTIYAWISSGKLDPETGELIDVTEHVRGSKKEYIDHRTQSVMAERGVPA